MNLFCKAHAWLLRTKGAQFYVHKKRARKSTLSLNWDNHFKVPSINAKLGLRETGNFVQEKNLQRTRG